MVTECFKNPKVLNHYFSCKVQFLKGFGKMSRVAIAKSIQANYAVANAGALRRALKSGVAKGELTAIKGSYRLAPGARKPKKVAKKKGKKKTATKKKTGGKKKVAKKTVGKKKAKKTGGKKKAKKGGKKK